MSSSPNISTSPDKLVGHSTNNFMFKLVLIFLLQPQLTIGLGVYSIKEQILLQTVTSAESHVNIASIHTPPPPTATSRRNVIKNSLLTVLGTTFVSFHNTDEAFAIDDNNIDENSKDDLLVPSLSKKNVPPRKPFAPASALLPAARVKFTIDQSVNLVDELLALGNGVESKGRKYEIITILRRNMDTKTFMVPPRSTEESSSLSLKPTPAPKSNSKLYEKTYQEKLKSMPVTDVPLALITKSGDYRQFRNLQARQRKLEKTSPIREAFNYYSRQLQFNTESYVLNANAEEKKRMIRDDALPDIKNVIVSDLDLRDLVRNQVLDAFDDCKAELQYQVKNYESEGIGGDEDQYTELKNVLLRAKGQCDVWFGFISEDDTKEAMETVMNE